MMRNIAIIIPSFNERNNISILIKKLIKLVPNSIIFIVDDNSPDKTGEVVQKLARKNKRIKLIKRGGKGGRGGAVLAGFREAFKNTETENFIEMDADLSHSPEEINSLIKNSKKNTIIIGSRYIKGSKILNWPLYRRVLSKFANFYIRIILGIRVNDFTNGFRSYPRNSVQALIQAKVDNKGFIALSEMAYILHLKGFKFLEIPTTFKDRESGKSNATALEVLKSLIAVVRIRTLK